MKHVRQTSGVRVLVENAERGRSGDDVTHFRLFLRDHFFLKGSKYVGYAGRLFDGHF